MKNQKPNSFQFIWSIENYRFAWHSVNEYITSPLFEAFSLDGGVWCLKLYPRGVSKSGNCTAVFIERQETVLGPKRISVDYEISFLNSDGVSRYTAAENGRSFEKGQAFGFSKMVTREDIFRKESIFLTQGTLFLQCSITLLNVEVDKHIQAYAKSSIMINRQTFSWANHGFSLFSPNGTEWSTKVASPTIDLSLKFMDDNVYVVFSCTKSIARVFRCRVGIETFQCSTPQYIVDEYMYSKDEQTISSLLVMKDDLLLKRELYQNFITRGKLVLLYELTYSARDYSGQFSETHNEIFRTNSAIDCNSCYCKVKPGSLKNDFKNFFEERKLFDFKLTVKGEEIQVHKAVLCARSHVFKAVLTSNLNKNVGNTMDIPSFDVDTIRRLVRFMYTDSASDMDLNKVNQLYIAGCKYGVLKLKLICSDILKTNLKMTNALQTLGIAERKADHDLKKAAMNFICQHNDVLILDGWRSFKFKNKVLASEIETSIKKKTSDSK